MNKFRAKRKEDIIGLNDDREGAFWQDDRGKRYGNNRKGIAKDKVRQRRLDRTRTKNEKLDE